MKKGLLFLFTFLLFGCNQTESIKGDLYFILVDLTAPSGLSGEQALQIEKLVASMASDFENLDEKSKTFVTYYQNVIKHNLLQNPYLQLETENGIRKVYLNSNEYDKIKNFTLSDLKEKSKKVVIELKFKKFEDDVFYSEEIISIKEVDGKTPWSK